MISHPHHPRAAQYSRTSFGAVAGREVDAITLSNSLGISVRILSLGATVQSIVAPDRNGNPADIALGYSGSEQYIKGNDYVGATLGRYANRIAHGRFILDGMHYQLATNDGVHALHGGVVGFSKQHWTVSDLDEGATAAVTLTLESPDGDAGYPGALRVWATFALTDNHIDIHYRATTNAPTLVNLSNHTYFNLAGEGSGKTILQHLLTLPADAFLPIDSSFIPTGEIRAVAGTPFDFRQPTALGRHIRDADEQLRWAHGYDHNWVVSPPVLSAPMPSAPAPKPPAVQPKLVARLYDPDSGRVVEVLSDQPGLQLYTGNFLHGQAIGKSGRGYRQADGLSLEPQMFPDTPNQPAFGSARLAPGDAYESRIVYRLSVADDGCA